MKMEFCKFCGKEKSENNHLIQDHQSKNIYVCFDCIKKFEEIISKKKDGVYTMHGEKIG